MMAPLMAPLMALLVVCAAWALPVASARAASDVIVLDDSRTYTDPANVQMQWRRQTPSNPAGGMEAWIRVNVHINTADYVGRSGRVYLVMPPDDNASLEATWTGKGFLKDGQVTSGERTLVFAGRIAADALTDQFTMRLRTGTDWRSDQRRIRMRFELELD
jgi:hypothetical protein